MPPRPSNNFSRKSAPSSSGLGLGKSVPGSSSSANARGKHGLGLGKSTAKRHRYVHPCLPSPFQSKLPNFSFHSKILRDNITGITKPAIRRLARRGGVKRISAGIYDEVRMTLREFLQKVIFKACSVTEMCKRKTVTTTDVVFALHRMGRTIYVSFLSLLGEWFGVFGWR